MQRIITTAQALSAGCYEATGMDSLDRALVMGLILEVVLDARASDPSIGCQHGMKARLGELLVSRLAGRVTLERFRGLVRQVDELWPVWYAPLRRETILSGVAPGLRSEPAPRYAYASPAAPVERVRHDLLRRWLAAPPPGLLPHSPQRKVRPDKLLAFLTHTRGGWFRVKDFQQWFHIDRKTAWEYLQALTRAGLLQHNQARSAAVRYALAPAFLLDNPDSNSPESHALPTAISEPLNVIPVSV
jgi:hypothetical protein